MESERSLSLLLSSLNETKFIGIFFGCCGGGSGSSFWSVTGTSGSGCGSGWGVRVDEEGIVGVIVGEKSDRWVC